MSDMSTMTGAEWEECYFPPKMLQFLGTSASDRKLRLYGCACCRRIWHLITDERSRSAIELAERHADGFAIDQELNNAWDDAEAARSGDSFFNRALSAAQKVLRDDIGSVASNIGWLCQEAVDIAESQPVYACSEINANPALIYQIIHNKERMAQCALLRDIFGNPFHPLSLRPEAITPLAERIYAGEWDLMPLLGEWLQEHGYWSEGEHCLDPKNQHVKGCWVVDWVTGRE